MEIRVVKLISGEEVIGKLLTEGEWQRFLKSHQGVDLTGSIVLKDAFVIAVGGNQFQLIPYSFSTNNGIICIRSHACSTLPYESNKTFEDAYIRQTSGLILDK